MLAVNERAHRRFALAIVASLEGAMTITQHLMRSGLEPRVISVIGQEACFAGERRDATELASIMSGSAKLPKLMIDSNQIVSLDRDTDTLPKTIATSPDILEKMLQRWLPPEHAKRLAGAVACGEFLLLVELHSLVEERVATRTLLRNCHGSVEVHDFDLAQSTGEFSL